MKNNFILTGALTALVMSGLAVKPACAQYNDINGFSYNNMQSATIGTMLQGMSNMAMMRSSLRSSLYRGGGRSGPSAQELQEQRGRRLIKSGRATVAFPMRTFPIGTYMSGAWSGHGDQNERKRNYAEWLVQKQIWTDEVRARGAKYGDYSHLLALAFVSCVEAYAGKRINNDGFRHKIDSIRRVYLRDANFQGSSATQKQQLYEAAMLSASYALYLRRSGNVAKARQVAGQWLNDNWNSDHHGVSDANDAVAALARYATKAAPRVAAVPAPKHAKPVTLAAPPNSTRRPAPAPAAMTLARAEQLTQFAPVAPSLLPDVLSKDRPKSRPLFVQALEAGEGKMRELFTVPPGQQSMADALTFAIVAFHTAWKTESGNIAEAGWTPQNLAGLNRQTTMMLAQDAKFQAQTPEKKQLMFESAVMMATVIGAMNGEAQRKNDAALRTQVKDSAARAMRSLVGASPDQLQLTAEGLKF